MGKLTLLGLLALTRLPEPFAALWFAGRLRTVDGRRIDPKAQAVGELFNSVRKPGVVPTLAESRASLQLLAAKFDRPCPAGVTRRDTVLHVALQVVQDCNTLLTPLLPHAAQKVFEALGGEGVWAAQPELVEVTEPGADAPYPVLRGDYVNQQAVWRSTPIAVGTPLNKPSPIFTKLDPKLAETGPEWAPIG